MDNYETQDLGLASFLYAKGKQLSDHKKSGRLVIFSFTTKTECEELAKEYYKNAVIPAMAFWHSTKMLKNIIHERD